MADQNVLNQQAAAAAKSAEEQRKANEEAKKIAVEGVDARLKVKDDQVQAKAEREANLQPTPTQRENDLARVGALDIDDKEDDGSEADAENVNRVLAAKLPGANPYENATSESSEESKPKAAKRGKRKGK